VNLATGVLIFLLCIDAIAWAALVGLVPGLFWLGAAFGIAWGHRWLERQEGKIPSHRTRRRPL
jgi:hypothetical protein